MTITAKQPRPKKCAHQPCGASFVPQRLGQKVCSPACALAMAPSNAGKARKAIDQLERKKNRARKEKIKTNSDHMREAQAAFNAWVRERDRDQPCISCGRHHAGKYDAGHYRTVGSNPALRFEPLNCHKQCVPCNQHKSGNIVEYRINLIKRIGAQAVEWLEGPHEPLRLTADEIKAIKARYRALARKLRSRID